MEGGGGWHKALVVGVKGGGGLGPPSSEGLPMVPAEGGPNVLKLKSSWHPTTHRVNGASVCP